MYLLEGNMGVGKSTLLKAIEKELPHLKVVFEPVSAWHDENYGSSLLSNFYHDQKRWSYTMEKYTLITRVKEYSKELKENAHCKIMERSIYSGYFCFAQNGYLQGNMSETEWTAYNAWFKFLVSEQCPPPLGFIYLYSTPEVSLKRMQQRARPGEEIVPLSYLYELHNAHEKFLSADNSVLPELKDIPILKLDVSEEFIDDRNKLNEILSAIETFIGTTHNNTLFKPKTSIQCRT